MRGFEENGVLCIWSLVSFSQHFIFLITYTWAQWARVFVPGNTFLPGVMKHSSFLGQCMSYEENEVLWIWSLESYSQHFILFITYTRAQWPIVFVPGNTFLLSVMKHSSLLGPCVSYEENKVLWIWSLESYSQHFILFITYTGAQWATLFVPGNTFLPGVMKHSSYLAQCMRYEENEMLWIWSLESYSQHFIFLITYTWSQWARVCAPDNTFLSSLLKHSSLLGPCVSCEDNELLWIGSLLSCTLCCQVLDDF